MINAANRAQTKWNAANYTQIKAYVAPDVASAFKAACASAGVSMNSVLSQFMAGYCGLQTSRKASDKADFTSSNRKRRKKHEELLSQFIQMRDEQESANDNVHENFRNTENFEASEERAAKMDEVIEILEGIY
jgi:hypothetical protein